MDSEQGVNLSFQGNYVCNLIFSLLFFLNLNTQKKRFYYLNRNFLHFFIELLEIFIAGGNK